MLRVLKTQCVQAIGYIIVKILSQKKLYAENWQKALIFLG